VSVPIKVKDEIDKNLRTTRRPSAAILCQRVTAAHVAAPKARPVQFPELLAINLRRLGAVAENLLIECRNACNTSSEAASVEFE
jgi:hypothetical protein